MKDSSRLLFIAMNSGRIEVMVSGNNRRQIKLMWKERSDKNQRIKTSSKLSPVDRTHGPLPRRQPDKSDKRLETAMTTVW